MVRTGSHLQVVCLAWSARWYLKSLNGGLLVGRGVPLAEQKFFSRVRGFSGAAELIANGGKVKRTRGIGSGDPSTDPYYNTADKYLD